MHSVEDPWAKAAALRENLGIRTRIIAANAAGAAVVAVSAIVIGWPTTTVTQGRFGHDTFVSVLVGIVYLAVAVPVGDVRARRRAARSFHWIDARRTPTEREVAAALDYSWAQAVEIFVWWLGGMVLYVALNISFGNAAAYCVRTGVSVALGGLATAALSFFLLERFNRPIFAVALAGEARVAGRGVGIRRRFLLIWALAAAVPVLTIVTAPAGLTVTQRADLWSRLLIIGALGLLAGLVLTIATARSVTEPLDELRGSVRRLASGDLDVTVSVDDAGEIGLLQAGFNGMVDGLRERRQLQDLFGRHVGIEVARHALERGVQLGGERRPASVLFIDLIGSTSMAQRLPAEEVVGVLNELFSAVVRCAGDEAGWVNKFEGDAALCVFGPPAGDDEHARHALRAARALRAAVDELARRHPGVDAGIGVSTGEVVAGNVGAEDRFEYTVIGDPVNRAARLCEAAKACETRLVACDTTIAAGGDEAAHWIPAGAQVLRGRKEPTAMFTLRPRT